LVEHTINTGNAPPVRQAPRRVPLSKRDEADQEIKMMERKGIIQPSTSPWCSPVCLVTKKDGSVRFCIDFRRLNDITIKDSHPLPRIDDTLDALSGSTWYSSLDLKNGYWQVGVAEEDRVKTAFSIQGGGLWEFCAMPMGLCNAAATFERLMESILGGLTWKICLVYLDDIILYSKGFDEQLSHLRQVFQRIREANLKLNPKKCNLFRKKVTFLGPVVSEQGISTDPAKIEAVKAWPTPKNVKEVRSLLGFAHTTDGMCQVLLK
jgi:hypothetical protein